MQWSYDLLAQQGRMICYGSAQFTPGGDAPSFISLAWKYLFRPKFDPLSMITANKSIMAFNLIWLYEKAPLMRQLMGEIHTLQLPSPYIGHRFKFEDLPEAMRLFKTGKTTGKVVISLG
jgi:alcohol dehydrogenase